MLELARNGFGLCSNSSVGEFGQPELSPNSSVNEFGLCSNLPGTGSGCGRTPSLPEVELAHEPVPVRGLIIAPISIESELEAALNTFVIMVLELAIGASIFGSVEYSIWG